MISRFLLLCLLVALVLGKNGTHPPAPANCSTLSSCASCSEESSCLWCEYGAHNFTKKCMSFSEAAVTECGVTGWCAGDSCTCTWTPTSNSLLSMFLMILFYGGILGFAAKMIADGSEELLELFPDYGTVIGALLLPVLGGVPDAAMVLFSGIGGTREEASQQLSVGMGTLAGSTIMLLTLPWSASLWVARTDIVNGESVDGKRTVTGLSAIFNSGVTVDNDTSTNAMIAIFTTLSFWFVQGIAFAHMKDPENAWKVEHPFALAGFITCGCGFFAYSIYQLIIPKLAEKRKAKAEELANEKKERVQALHVIKKLHDAAKLSVQRVLPLDLESQQQSKEEHAQAVALKFGQKWKAKALGKKKKDVTEVTPLVNPSKGSDSEESIALRKRKVSIVQIAEVVEAQEVEEEGKEEGSFGKNLAYALFMMLVGAGLVGFFADPMVDVITKLGNFWNVSPFYISFIVTPFCSNASELVASLIFAAKMTKVNSSMTYSQLYGAATMNCTLSLCIFFALIYFRELSWVYSAETMAILFVIFSVCGVATFKRTFSLIWIIPNLALYPLSLVLVWSLEHFLDWQ